MARACVHVCRACQRTRGLRRKPMRPLTHSLMICRLNFIGDLLPLQPIIVVTINPVCPGSCTHYRSMRCASLTHLDTRRLIWSPEWCVHATPPLSGVARDHRRTTHLRTGHVPLTCRPSASGALVRLINLLTCHYLTLTYGPSDKIIIQLKV